MCGVFGVHGHPEAAKLTYLGLHTLQHRGQESAGIVSCDGRQLHAHRAMGLVSDVFDEKVLGRLPGQSAIGHVRYSTAGVPHIKNAQPLAVEYARGSIAVAHNGNLTNATELRAKLEARGSIFTSSADTEVVVHLLAAEADGPLPHRLRRALSHVKGAYSLLFLAPGQLVAVRDPWGFRPLALGRIDPSPKNNLRPAVGRQDSLFPQLDGSDPDSGEGASGDEAEGGGAPVQVARRPGSGPAWVVASETCAFGLIEATFVRELAPGEIVVIDDEGPRTVGFMQQGQQLGLPPGPEPERPAGFCVFEYVYFARPDSVIQQRSVAEVRKRLGQQLAVEHPADADLVIPIPDSGTPSAIGYSQRSGLPFDFGLIRSHYVGRTFIEPRQSIRHFGVKLKLSAVPSVLAGKRVVVVDDSIVRGTTSRKIVKMLRAAGAKEVHLRISSPPVVSPCFYGIDTPTRTELIASSHTVDEIARYITCDSLGYLSKEGMVEAVRGTPTCATAGEGGSKSSLCTACFTGRYPVGLVPPERQGWERFPEPRPGIVHTS
jgi:amidophosphoribosyltransferase